MNELICLEEILKSKFFDYFNKIIQKNYFASLVGTLKPTQQKPIIPNDNISILSHKPGTDIGEKGNTAKKINIVIID